VEELNSLQLDATFEAVVHQLNTEFPDMELPSEEILLSSLNSLVAEKKLTFDYQGQMYRAARSLLTPWDEFESLTLSDHFKLEKEEDELELEFNSMHPESADRCANLDQLFYLKSKTLSTEDSSSVQDRENHILTSPKLLRRNSSLSNEIDNSKHKKTNFKRSNSFKMRYKSTSDDNSQLLNKDCTCNEIIIKRKC